MISNFTLRCRDIDIYDQTLSRLACAAEPRYQHHPSHLSKSYQYKKSQFSQVISQDRLPPPSRPNTHHHIHHNAFRSNPLPLYLSHRRIFPHHNRNLPHRNHPKSQQNPLQSRRHRNRRESTSNLAKTIQRKEDPRSCQVQRCHCRKFSPSLSFARRMCN